MFDDKSQLEVALHFIMLVTSLCVSLISLYSHFNASLDDYTLTFFTFSVTPSFIFFLVFGLVCLVYSYGFLRAFVFYPSQEKDDKKFEKKFIKAWQKSQQSKAKKKHKLSD